MQDPGERGPSRRRAAKNTVSDKIAESLRLALPAVIRHKTAVPARYPRVADARPSPCI